jgi:lipoprotein-anchoring transpeptidase ErfK/SrfK
MPWSVFFHGGYAVHGTTEIRRLGKPASHGCVRLHPDNARTFFTLVKEAGLEQSQIVVME